MIEDVIRESEDKMKKTIESLKRELTGIRTGRATPALLERVTVDYYGTPTPINQVANVSVPEPRLLMISPWDRSLLPTIERALLKSDLGITPNSDGTVIRLALPSLTEERRKELVKSVSKKSEEEKVAIRNIRREANEHLKKLQKDSKISEDEEKRAEEKVQKLTDKYIVEIDQITKAKDAEIMEV
jgi:ribosome recycling factor